MAERKGSTVSSTHSKGGAGVYTKHIQRKLSRAQEKVKQKFGKLDETRDAQFEICVENLQDQQSDGHRIYKDLKAYLNAVKVMGDASSRLFQSLFDVYELDWEGGENLGAVVEGEDLLWNDYETKLRDQLFTMQSYMGQFPDIKERVAKRNRKLVDFDSSRHHLESLQNAKKRDAIKAGKAEEEMKSAKKIFETMNCELKEELPVLYNSRIGCYVTVFQAISDLRDIFYKEMSKNNQDLQNVMSNLSAQHPEKKFMIKNFSRGSLKRRSLKDTLSPRSLRSSFLEFHASYSPKGPLRRENSSSFRSDRAVYGSYSPEHQTSPSRFKPTEIPDPRVEGPDQSCTSEKTLPGEDTPSAATVTDNTEASGRACSEVIEGDQPSVSRPDKEKTGPCLKDDSSLEASDENDQEKKEDHSERASPETSCTLDAPEVHSQHLEQMNEPGPVGRDNGIADSEESEGSCKHTTMNDMLGKTKEETEGPL
ncbi:bridging integrator 2a isoform X2 [Electrophorus electricus]|uniref:BAR domain-containing protein n=1 Tax=Electrophorus electricus TaxID=8005 RepID=A0A4W4HRH5_ELEEL|nr:bridging integrator 2a isoform X2 [Electrophorus electricus]